MANAQQPLLSSIFDAMLAKNRTRFEDLYRGGHRRPGAPGVDTASAAAEDRNTAGTGAPLDPASSPAVRRLNERFGKDWRYEIAARQREGDEAIVLCKLFLDKEGAVRTQFGRAKFSRPVVGASGGVRFKLEAAGPEPDERDAFRRATEAALMNCIGLL